MNNNTDYAALKMYLQRLTADNQQANDQVEVNDLEDPVDEYAAEEAEARFYRTKRHAIKTLFEIMDSFQQEMKIPNKIFGSVLWFHIIVQNFFDTLDDIEQTIFIIDLIEWLNYVLEQEIVFQNHELLHSTEHGTFNEFYEDPEMEEFDSSESTYR